MAACASLRFEPVGCVVTLIAADGYDVSILDVLPGHSRIVLRRGGNVDEDNGDEYFSDVCGSAMLVGTPASSGLRCAAAAIIDLPDGRRRLNGVATLRQIGAHIAVDVVSDDGALEVRLVCRVADDAHVVPPSPTGELRSIDGKSHLSGG